MTTTPPPDEPIRPGAARDAVMAATRDARPFTDHGHGMELFVASCPAVAIGLIVWIASAEGHVTPTLGYLAGLVVAMISALTYRVVRGRI